MNNIYEIGGHRYTAIDGDLYEIIRIAPTPPGGGLQAPVTAKTSKTKTKTAKPPKSKGARGKYDPDQIRKLAARVEAGELTTQEAADEMGVSKANWYYLKNTYLKKVAGKKKASLPAKTSDVDAEETEDEPGATQPSRPVLICHICELDHMTRDCPDFGSKVAEMRADGMDSLQIASRLKIRLKDIPVE